MSDYALPFIPHGDLGELFLYTQKWARSNYLGSTPVLFKAYLATAQSINNATYTKVLLDTEVYDYSSNFDLDTNKRFVAPTNGVYHIVGATGIASIGDGKYMIPLIYKNGSSIAAGNSFAVGASSSPRGQVSTTLYLNANDYIELYVYHTHGSSRNTSAGEDDTFMTCYRIAA